MLTLHPEDVPALLQACGDAPVGQRDKAIIALLADTRCRPTALLTLTCDHLHLSQHHAVLGGCTVTFTPATHDLLQGWLAVRPAEADNWVFCSLLRHDLGQPLTLYALGGLLQRRFNQAKHQL